jgi:hypothetical protein
MDFLKPPTDNLYKFLAMSGLLLLLVCQTYPPWLSYRLSISMFELDKDIKVEELEIKAEETRGKDFKAELDVSQADADDLLKESENLKRLVESQPSHAQKRRLVKERVGPLEKKSRLLQARVEEIKKGFPEKRAAFTASSDAIAQKLIEVEYKHDLIKWELRQLKLLGWVANFGAGLGALMATWGFRLWYRRVQVYQDAILRKQAAALESERESESPES